MMPTAAAWYFDPISPYAYLQLPDLDRLPPGVVVNPVPVLLAGLLKHSGGKGPAEIPGKRLHTYRQCAWLAAARGLPFQMPPRHPFNPLPALRLLCGLGPTLDQARIACRFVFERGQDPSTPEGLKELGRLLGVEQPEELATAASAKSRLRNNTDAAIEQGVWGVPTFRIAAELFWGADSFPMMLDYLQNPGLFESPEMKRLAMLPIGVVRG
jgi:2-hydroxychromene-2-carboxylate isomerase